MADKKIPATKLILGATKGKPVRFSHLHVFEARLNTESGNNEFSTAVLIPKENVEDIKAIKAAIELQKKLTWLDEKKKIPPQFWNPLRDGDTDTKQNGDPYGEEAQGHYLLNCKSGEDSPPEVVGTTRVRDEKTGKVKFARLDKGDIKSGDWGRVSVNLTAYIKGTGGVGAYINSVQKTEDGEPLANRSSADDDFGQFDDADDDLLG